MSLEKDTEGILKIIPTKSKSPNAPNTLSVDWLLMGIQLAHQMQSIHEGKERRTVLHIDSDVIHFLFPREMLKMLKLPQEEAKQQAPQRIHRPVADHRVYRSRCASEPPVSVMREGCANDVRRG